MSIAWNKSETEWQVGTERIVSMPASLSLEATEADSDDEIADSDDELILADDEEDKMAEEERMAELEIIADELILVLEGTKDETKDEELLEYLIFDSVIALPRTSVE